MKELIFTIIFKDSANLTNNSLKQLYSSAAVIGLHMINSQDWSTFISDIISLSQNSNENLLIVLEVLSVLSKELQSKSFNQEQRNNIKKALKNSDSQVFQVLYHILTSGSYNETIIPKALRATSSWVHLGAVELINFPSLIDTLITYTNKAEFCYLAIEVLNEGVKNSQYPEQFFIASVEGKESPLSDEAKVSIQKMLQLFHEIKSANKDLSTLPAAYELNELAVNIATSFNIFILEVYQNYINHNCLIERKLLQNHR